MEIDVKDYEIVVLVPKASKSDNVDDHAKRHELYVAGGRVEDFTGFRLEVKAGEYPCLEINPREDAGNVASELSRMLKGS